MLAFGFGRKFEERFLRTGGETWGDLKRCVPGQGTSICKGPVVAEEEGW